MFSRNRKNINWRAVTVLLLVNFLVALFFIKSSSGRDAIVTLATGFQSIVSVANDGIKVVAAGLVPEDGSQMSFFAGALLPILMIVPLFDILTYFGVLPFIVRYIGKLISYVTRVPKFESFFSIEMMFLGNLEVLAVSILQLNSNKPERNLTLAMMSMSCVSAAILSAYMNLMPAEYVLVAVPLNVINVLIITSILNPVQLSPEEDTIATYDKNNRKPFFAFLGESIMNSGKLVLIIAATVITFISFVSLINKGLQLIYPDLTLMSIMGLIFYPLSWLLGLGSEDAFIMGQIMGTKIITNEFIAMLSVQDIVQSFSPHLKCVATMFVTSFANLGTLGMVIGFFSGLNNHEKFSVIFNNVAYLLLSGVLVSLMTAGIGGLFVW
ncbi:MAG: hypothetical protein J5934_02755 [Succinivibrio sp.]|nr:hypothetical protein [Succinivibrio sp.]